MGWGNYRARRVLGSGIVMASMVFSLFFTLIVLEAPSVSAFDTPDTGVVWTMDDLVANSSGAVQLISPGQFLVNETINIMINDTIIIQPSEYVFMNATTGWNVSGKFYIGGAGAEAYVNSSAPAPQPGDWGAITVLGGDVFFNNATVQHGIYGVHIMGGNCTLANTTVYNVLDSGIRFQGGSLTVRNSTIYGGSLVTVPSLGRPGIELTGTATGPIIVVNNEIMGGNANDNSSGGAAIWSSGLNQPILVLNNTLIQGGDGGTNIIVGGFGGIGGDAIYVENPPDLGSTPVLLVSGNGDIKGGFGGENTGIDGQGGDGGSGIKVTNIVDVGRIVVQDNSLIHGGSGGYNRGDVNTKIVQGGNGGNAIHFLRMGSNSFISNNTKIQGGGGGGNTGVGSITFLSYGGAGGKGVYVNSISSIEIDNSIIFGGLGGLNEPIGFDGRPGVGGDAVQILLSIETNITNSEIIGGEGGEEQATGGSSAIMNGGLGGSALYHNAALLNITRTNLTGGRGGDNYAPVGGGGGSGGDGLIPSLNSQVNINGGRIEGGRGGDNHFSGLINAGLAGPGIFVVTSVESMMIDGTSIVGGKGGDIINGTGWGGDGGNGAVISGVVTDFSLSNSPNITSGARGLNFDMGGDGSIGSYGLGLFNVGGSTTVFGNTFGIAGIAAFHATSEVFVDNNTMIGPNTGVSLLSSGASQSMISNLNYSNPTGTGILVNGCTNITIYNVTLYANLGISLTNSDANVTYANITSQGNGIRAGSSTLFVENSTISPVDPQRSFTLQPGSNIITLNTTFPFGDLANVNSNSALTVMNYLDVEVRDLSSVPILGADLQVLDNSLPVYASGGFGGTDPTTNSNGRIEWIVVTDRIFNGSSSATENVTTAEVSSGGKAFLNNPRSVNMSTSHTEYFLEYTPDNTPPEISNVVLTGPILGKAGANTTINVTATIDDILTGGRNISAANYTFGAGNWPSAQLLNATDGLFDSPIEDVYGLFNTNSLPFGLTDICVYAQDEVPNFNTTGSCVSLFVDNRGPKIFSMMFNGAVPPISISMGDDILVMAILDDSMDGDSLFSFANVTVDGMFRIVLSPSDGLFDTSNESVYAVVSTAPDGPGPHDLCLEVIDEFGNNATSCGVFTSVPDTTPPQILNVRLNGSVSMKVANVTINLTATLQDTTSIIGGANYTIGVQNWTSSQPMIPSDGLLDSTNEDFYAIFSTATFLSGTYSICVYGWDSEPNYNTTGACATLIIDKLPPMAYSILHNGLVPPISIPMGDPINVSAIADDLSQGDSLISSSSYVSTNFTASMNMLPLDGTFDTMNESLYAVLSTVGAAKGLYNICVHAIDEFSNSAMYCSDINIIDQLPPIILTVNVSPSRVGPSTVVNLSAMIDDTSRGNSIIAGANYTIGADNWTSSQPMMPVDGVFDEPFEDVYLLLNSDNFAMGQYQLCVYAWDIVPNYNTTGTCVTIVVDKLGPDIQALEFNGFVPPIAVGKGLTVTVTASLFEQFITIVASANITVDGIDTGAMSAVDGTFDETNEDVSGSLDTSSLSLDNHIVCVMAVDEFNNSNQTCETLTVADIYPPTITNVKLEGQDAISVTPGTLVNITADITDIGGSTVAGANFTVGGDWATSQTFAAADGTFDEVDESVMSTLDTSSLSTGQHAICVYAVDSASNANTTGACRTLTIVPLGDITPPTVDSYLPAATTGIAVTAEIFVVFSEVMNTTSTTNSISITPSITFQTYWQGTTLRVVPDSVLNYSTVYQVRVLATFAQDVAGNPLDGNQDGTGGDDFLWSFTTEEKEVVPEEVDWTMYILIIVIVVIILIIVAVAMTRKRKREPVKEEVPRELEPEPEEEPKEEAPKEEPEAFEEDILAEDEFDFDDLEKELKDL